MTLDGHELMRLQQLLALQQSGQLGFLEEQELRTLMSRQNPRAATMTIDELVKAALFVVGLYALFRILSK